MNNITHGQIFAWKNAARDNYLFVLATTVLFVLGIQVLTAYSGLIPVGHWQDEYYALPRIAEGGWEYLASTRLIWSPRPFSEMLIALYANLVARFQAPYIGTTLTILWAALTTSFFLIPLLAFRQLGLRITILFLAVSLCYFCLLLLGNPVSEMFYWPMGAIAYLPAIGCLWVAVWIFICNDITNAIPRKLISFLLIISATSAEVGAMVVTAFCAGSLVYLEFARLRRKPSSRRYYLWLLLPLIVSASVFYIIKSGRLGSSGEIMGSTEIAHHLIPTTTTAIIPFFGAVLSFFFSKALFFASVVGIFWSLPPHYKERIPRHFLCIMSLSCFATIFLSIAAAYYQFGVLCCERHSTFRQCLVLLGLLTGGGFLSLQFLPSAELIVKIKIQVFTVILLVMSILPPAISSLPKIIIEYQLYDTYLALRIDNWKEGLAQKDTMIFRVGKLGPILGGIDLPEGTYNLQNKPHWVIESIMDFFHKESITIITFKGVIKN